ncbi:triose-phosphate isomerase, partial [bacterium]
LLGAQNCHWAESGAFTGEISPSMLAECGCSFAILGHSERRQFFGENDSGVSKRAHALLKAGMVPVVCVGETLDEREAGAHLEVVEKQLTASLEGIEAGSLGRVVIAYEPVWAIGTGKTASPEQAQQMHEHIRKILIKLGGAAVADGIRILYGGSVTPDNAAILLKQPDIDGALVGGASLDAQKFASIVRFSV